MVIFIEKRGKNLFFLPKNVNKTFMKYWLEIKRDDKVEYVDVNDELCYNSWYSFLVDFSLYEDGEYTYKLYGDGELLGYGLVQIGDYKIESKNYKTPHKIKEYNV